MSWPCRLIEIDPEHPVRDQTIEIGDMWYGDIRYAECAPMGEDYTRNRAGRRPLWVKLPSKDFHCIDGASYDGTQWGAGWTVTGEPPAITVTPSINYTGRWHGYITNGVITDDVEGRTYP